MAGTSELNEEKKARGKSKRGRGDAPSAPALTRDARDDREEVEEASVSEYIYEFFKAI